MTLGPRGLAAMMALVALGGCGAATQPATPAVATCGAGHELVALAGLSVEKHHAPTTVWVSGRLECRKVQQDCNYDCEDCECDERITVYEIVDETNSQRRNVHRHPSNLEPYCGATIHAEVSLPAPAEPPSQPPESAQAFRERIEQMASDRDRRAAADARMAALRAEMRHRQYTATKDDLIVHSVCAFR